LSTKAKKNLIHLIPIKNWLNSGQRFSISWKFDVEEKTVFINAANTFDVSGDSAKDYKLSIYALKTCNCKFTIYFKNAVTHEFISFRVVLIFFIKNLTVTPADLMEPITLSSLVRETTHKLITL
jgi:hydrocephalus-inducing protein